MVSLSVVIDVMIFYGSFFFFNDTATTEIYTLSLHDALPIWYRPSRATHVQIVSVCSPPMRSTTTSAPRSCVSAITRSKRSEEHTSELQSRLHLVCRLLLEKKKPTHST